MAYIGIFVSAHKEYNIYSHRKKRPQWFNCGFLWVVGDQMLILLNEMEING